jgi:hypothetical protein
VRRDRLASLASFVLALLAALPASAEPKERTGQATLRAKEAYDRGLLAHEHGDMHRAAEEFARADALAPSTEALQAALDAAVQADDVALGAELLERARREPPPPSLASSITAAHLKFSSRAGRIRVVCPGAARCSAKLDDRPVDVDRVVWTVAGQRSVTVILDGSAHTRVVDVSNDQVTEISPAKGTAPLTVTPRAPSAEPEENAPTTRHGHDHDSDGRLPRIVFYSGVGLTSVFALTALYFGLDAAHQHRTFRNTGCSVADNAGCEDVRTRGQDDQTATNVALVLTGLSAAATAVIGIAFTDWSGPVVSATPSGAAASWRVRF